MLRPIRVEACRANARRGRRALVVFAAAVMRGESAQAKLAGAALSSQLPREAICLASTIDRPPSRAARSRGAEGGGRRSRGRALLSPPPASAPRRIGRRALERAAPDGGRGALGEDREAIEMRSSRGRRASRVART